MSNFFWVAVVVLLFIGVQFLGDHLEEDEGEEVPEAHSYTVYINETETVDLEAGSAELDLMFPQFAPTNSSANINNNRVVLRFKFGDEVVAVFDWDNIIGYVENI